MIVVLRCAFRDDGSCSRVCACVCVQRSLTFSEHQTETREIRDQAFKARKVKEVKLDAVVDRKAGTEKRMTKNSNPSVVDAVIQRRAEETKRDQVGVWSPLGYMYEPQGRPELELGEDRSTCASRSCAVLLMCLAPSAALREMLAKRKPRRSAAEDSSATGKQKLEGLVDLFRDTKHTLAAINLVCAAVVLLFATLIDLRCLL